MSKHLKKIELSCNSVVSHTYGKWVAIAFDSKGKVPEVFLRGCINCPKMQYLTMKKGEK